MQRLPGSQCTSSLGLDWIDDGTLSLGKSSAPQPLGGAELTPEERERLLDLSQMVLDLAGFVDPTPFSDGSNAAISISRGDWFGAGLSGISLIPYVGDLAKIGKLGRWAQAVHKSVELARRNARFGERMRPVFAKLSNVLDQIPSSMLPESAQATLNRIKSELASVLGASMRLPRLALLEKYLQHGYRYIDELPLPPPPANAGALWSKLGAIEPGTEGAVLAERMARADNKVTLEMTLEASEFQARYKLAMAQLKEQLGEHAGDLWQDFGKKVWTRVSERYAGLLQGRVVAYTKYQGAHGVQAGILDKTGITRAIDEFGSVDTNAPILVDELWELSEILQRSPAVTSVEVVDVVTGLRRTMRREDVLRSVHAPSH